VTKVCYGSKGLELRHVVTSLPAAKVPPSQVYTDKYCPRGEMENRLKEQQLDLFADRTSTQTFESNQLRLWLSAMAYSGFQLDEVQWQPVNSDTLAQPVYSAYLKSAVCSDASFSATLFSKNFSC